MVTMIDKSRCNIKKEDNFYNHHMESFFPNAWYSATEYWRRYYYYY